MSGGLVCILSQKYRHVSCCLARELGTMSDWVLFYLAKGCDRMIPNYTTGSIRNTPPPSQSVPTPPAWVLETTRASRSYVQPPPPPFNDHFVYEGRVSRVVGLTSSLPPALSGRVSSPGGSRGVSNAVSSFTRRRRKSEGFHDRPTGAAGAWRRAGPGTGVSRWHLPT